MSRFVQFYTFLWPSRCRMKAIILLIAFKTKAIAEKMTWKIP